MKFIWSPGQPSPAPLMIRLLLLLALLLCSTRAEEPAPLYLHAMNSWSPDTFRLQVIHQEPLPASISRMLSALTDELHNTPPSANLQLEVVDLASVDPERASQIHGLNQVRFWPAAILHAPKSWGETTPLVFGASQQTIERVLHSPIRQRIVDELTSGVSAVWCLVESGDSTADQQALDVLQTSLEKLSSEPSPTSNSGKFLIERVRRDDPAEQGFLKVLMGPARRPITGPVFVPVFGRGRTTGPIPASVSGEERILTVCESITETPPTYSKEESSGYDLLFSSTWRVEAPPREDGGESDVDIPRESELSQDDPVRETASSAGRFAALVGGGALLLGVLGIISLKFRS